MIEASKVQSGQCPSWRPCPFRIEVAYRVLHDFQSADWPFGGDGAIVKAGQVLIFELVSWSRYDGMAFYLFRDASGQFCAWGLGDDEDVGRWQLFFEERSNIRG